jgi:hypothetical protein
MRLPGLYSTPEIKHSGKFNLTVFFCLNRNYPVCVCVCVCVGPKMHCPGVHPFSLSLALVVPTFNRLTVSFTAGDFRTEKDRMRVRVRGGQFYTCVIIIIILL